VLFYDMLMRMWGVEEVSVVDAETYSVSSTKKEPAAESQASVKKEAKAPVEAAQKNNSFPLAKPAADVKGDKTEPSVRMKAQSVPPPDAILPGQTPAESPAGGSENYTVVGVGANVRSGPGMGNDVVTFVKEGDVFKGLGEKQGRWEKIQAPDGKEGWIST
jgi:hypothetical protein